MSAGSLFFFLLASIAQVRATVTIYTTPTVLPDGSPLNATSVLLAVEAQITNLNGGSNSCIPPDTFLSACIQAYATSTLQAPALPTSMPPTKFNVQLYSGTLFPHPLKPM